MIRLIARLDIKGENLIKGVHLEGLRVMGDPQAFSQKYYLDGADELIYIDSVASLYGRNNLTDIVRRTAKDIFVPLTVGGGVRSVEDVRHLLASGADKVAINTAAVKNPGLISEVSRRFGSQCMVLSVEAKQASPGKWEAYTDNGREKTGLDVVEWVREAVRLGAGEVLLTSVDKEGTKKGFDIPLLTAISELVNVPVIASGGMGNLDHLFEAVEKGHANAVAMASVLHYGQLTLSQIRSACRERNMVLRDYEKTSSHC